MTTWHPITHMLRTQPRLLAAAVGIVCPGAGEVSRDAVFDGLGITRSGRGTDRVAMRRRRSH